MANKPDNTRKLSADKIVVLPLAEIRPYDKNPRKNEKAVKYVKESIRQFGFKVPIVIDSNRVIVCGHTRLLAAKSLGMTEVPCIMADDLTDDQVKAFRLADNKVGEFAECDMDLLGGELDNIVHIKPTRNEYSKYHNAVFPVELAAHFISNFSTESVLDLFGGSGTTLIAAEQLGRKCRMMELDPHYCDVIIARWEKLTGQKAVKVED